MANCLNSPTGLHLSGFLCVRLKFFAAINPPSFLNVVYTIRNEKIGLMLNLLFQQGIYRIFNERDFLLDVTLQDYLNYFFLAN